MRVHPLLIILEMWRVIYHIEDETANSSEGTDTDYATE
jgi:hypothetical protein